MAPVMAQKKVDTGPAVTSGGPEGDVSAELFIGMISLRTCPERRAFFEHGWREQVGKFAQSPDKADEFMGCKVHYHVADLDPEGGVLGCTRSHMALYQKAVESSPNLKAAIIFEDDVKVNSHFTPSVIQDLLQVVESGWDVIRFHKTGICKIHGALSENLYHSSNLCGRGYMISKELMQYVLKFDSKEVVPYTYFLPKGSSRQLTYHPSLITEGAFGSWNTKGFGRDAGAAQDKATETASTPAKSSPGKKTAPASKKTDQTVTAMKGSFAPSSRTDATTSKIIKPATTKEEHASNFSALALLQWSLKYTTALEQLVANVHFFTNLPSPLFTEKTFPKAETFAAPCREGGGAATATNSNWAYYRAKIGRYEPMPGVCPRRLSNLGADYFLREKLFGGSQAAKEENKMSAEVRRRKHLARREKRTGLLHRYSDVEGGSTSSSLDNSEYDVIVVGAGIAGSSTAYTLAERGAKVCLVEQWDVANENKRAHDPNSESMGSSRGGPRRIGTLDLAPGTRVREAWTSWCDLKEIEKIEEEEEGRTTGQKRKPPLPLFDVIGEVLVVSIFPFGWLLLIAFLCWWTLRRVFAGADSLPRGLELLWNRTQVLNKLPKNAFQFKSWNVFGIYYSDAAALYTKQILAFFHKKGNFVSLESSCTSDVKGPAGQATLTGEGGHQSPVLVDGCNGGKKTENSNFAIRGNTRVTNVRKVRSKSPDRHSKNATATETIIVVDCVDVVRQEKYTTGGSTTTSSTGISKPAEDEDADSQDPTHSSFQLRAKHVVIAGGGWTGELLENMGFKTKTKIGVFTCPSYDVNVNNSAETSPGAGAPSSPNKRRKASTSPQPPPLSVENHCPLFAFPGARIYGFPMAVAHEGHKVMSIRPNYPSKWCADPENQTHSDDHIATVDQFLTDYIREDALVSKKPAQQYSCRYPQLSIGSEEKFGAILDFIPDYDNRVILASGLDGYGFKYGSLYGKEVLDLLVTHQKVAGLEWEKKPAENILLRFLHNVLDKLLKMAGGDEEQDPLLKKTAKQNHYAQTLISCCCIAAVFFLCQVDLAYRGAGKILNSSGSTSSSADYHNAEAGAFFSQTTKTRFFFALQFLLVVFLNFAYSLGSEQIYRTPRSAEDWKRAGLVWGVHYLWALGAPMVVCYFGVVLFQHCAGFFSSSLSGTTVLEQQQQQAADQKILSTVQQALLFLLSILLTAAACYLRYRSMDECDHYDRSARCLQLPDEEFSDMKKTHETNTGRKSSKSEPKTKKHSGTTIQEVEDVRTVTMAGIYSYCRHPGFAAHILHATALAFAVVALFCGFSSVTAEDAANGSRNKEADILAAAATVTTAASRFWHFASLQSYAASGTKLVLFMVLIPLLHFGIALQIFSYSANDEEREMLKSEELRANYLEYQRLVPTQFNFLTKALEPVGEMVRGVRCGNGVGGVSERRIFLKLLALLQGTPVDFLDPVKDPELIEKVLEGSNKGHFVEELIACPAWSPVRSVESVTYPEAIKMKESLGMVFARIDIFDRLDKVIDEVIERDANLRIGTANSRMQRNVSEVTTECPDFLSTPSSTTIHTMTPTASTLTAQSSTTHDSSREVSDVEEFSAQHLHVGGGATTSTAPGPPASSEMKLTLGKFDSSASSNTTDVHDCQKDKNSTSSQDVDTASSRPRTGSDVAGCSLEELTGTAADIGAAAQTGCTSMNKSDHLEPQPTSATSCRELHQQSTSTTASQTGGVTATSNTWACPKEPSSSRPSPTTSKTKKLSFSKSKEECEVKCADVTRHSFEIFYKLLTDKYPTPEECDMAHRAVDEWRKMIAMKGLADSELKLAFLAFMRKSLKESPFFRNQSGEQDPGAAEPHDDGVQLGRTSRTTSSTTTADRDALAPSQPNPVVRRTRSETQKMADNYHFDWDNIQTLSCILQPMIISPMINFADVFSSLKKILDRHPHWREEICNPTQFSKNPDPNAQPHPNTGIQLGLRERTPSEEVADRVVLEGMRCAHPFPILERTVTKDVFDEATGDVRFKKGTQVFIEYDQYVQGEKSTCPVSGMMASSGMGSSACPFLAAQQEHQTSKGGESGSSNKPADATSSLPTATELNAYEEETPSLFDPNRWHDEKKCRFRAVPFGAGVRRCFGQKVARVILRKLLVAYAHNWDRFCPSKGHAFSGRNNDDDPGDTLYVAKSLARILLQGLQYRLSH